MALSAGACPEPGCEPGVTSTSRGGQAGRSARARLARSRGVGAGSGRRTRARAHPGSLGGRFSLSLLRRCSLVVPLKAAEAVAAPDTCGGDPPAAARRCGPWWRRCCWAPAAAVSGSGIPAALGLVRSTRAPPQECGLHPRRSGGAREKSEEERRGWRDARALRTPSAPVGGPRGASARLPAPLPPLSFHGPPFPPRESGLKLLTLQCAHVGKTRNNRNCASLNCKESEGGSCQEPPLLVPLSLLGASTQHLGLKVWSGRAWPLVMKCAFW